MSSPLSCTMAVRNVVTSTHDQKALKLAQPEQDIVDTGQLTRPFRLAGAGDFGNINACLLGLHGVHICWALKSRP